MPSRAPTSSFEHPAAISATTNVSFLDSAVPFSHLRLRFDANYRDSRPTRAEFLYPKGGLPFSPKFATVGTRALR